jgi:hypothetical protein
MYQWDPGTKTLTWNQGEEVVIPFRKLNVGTVTNPTVQFYKGSSDKTSECCETNVATVTNDGTTIVFTTPKFLNTIAPTTYKLHLKGTVDGLNKDIDTLTVVVLKRGI